MDIQYIILYIILAIVALVTVRHIYTVLHSPNQCNCGCHDCPSKKKCKAEGLGQYL